MIYIIKPKVFTGLTEVRYRVLYPKGQYLGALWHDITAPLNTNQSIRYYNNKVIPVIYYDYYYKLL